MKTIKKIEETLNKVNANNTFFNGISISTNLGTNDISLSYSMGLKIMEFNLTPFELIEDSFEYSRELFKEKSLTEFDEDAEVFSNKSSKIKEVLTIEDICEDVLKKYSAQRIKNVKNTFKKQYNDGILTLKDANNNFVDCIVEHLKGLNIERNGRTISTKYKEQEINMYIDQDTSIVSKGKEKYEIQITDSFDALEHLFNEVANYHVESSLKIEKPSVDKKHNRNKSLKLH